MNETDAFGTAYHKDSLSIIIQVMAGVWGRAVLSA